MHVGINRTVIYDGMLLTRVPHARGDYSHFHNCFETCSGPKKRGLPPI